MDRTALLRHYNKIQYLIERVKEYVHLKLYSFLTSNINNKIDSSKLRNHGSDLKLHAHSFVLLCSVK